MMIGALVEVIVSFMVVGALVEDDGTIVGIDVGKREGALEGMFEGRVAGIVVGENEGALEGKEVGVSDGCVDGT